MRVDILKSFENDIEEITDKKTLGKLGRAIEEWENCIVLFEVRNLKKMQTATCIFFKYYRIRVGDYRIGLRQNEKSIALVRFLHRKDIYKYFP